MKKFANYYITPTDQVYSPTLIQITTSATLRTMPVTFRFAAKRAFLTYSDVCEYITKEAILFDLQDRYPIKLYALGEEIHPSTGGRHIHVLIEFRSKVDSRDVTCFDVADSEHQHHPNIQVVKKGSAHWERVLDYVTKDDPNPLANVQLKPTWGEIFDQATSKEQFLELVKVFYPRDFALNLQRLEYSATRIFPTFDASTIVEFSLSWTLTFPPELALLRPLTGQSTVVVGTPGCGKTTWAKIYCPKPCLFVRHLDSLLLLRPEHRGIIFDDLDFRHLPPPTQKFLADTSDLAEIHVRYRVARIPPGITKIFTANEYPFIEEGIHGEAVRRRITRIDIL